MTTSEKSSDSVENTLKTYHAPNLIDYGQMSELTQTISGNTGDDFAGTPSSYTAS